MFSFFLKVISNPTSFSFFNKMFLPSIYLRLWTNFFLNSTLAIDSPFQTLAVGLLVELTLPLLSPETLSSLSKSRIFYLVCTLLYLSGWMTQLPAQMHR